MFPVFQNMKRVLDTHSLDRASLRLHLLQLPTKPTPRFNLISVPDKRKGYDARPNARKRQQRRSPRNAQATKQRLRRQGQKRAAQTARTTHGRLRADVERLVRVRHVVIQRDLYEEEADAKRQASHHGRPVGRARRGGPAEPEQRHGAEWPAGAGEWEPLALFVRGPFFVAAPCAVEEDLVDEEHCESEEAAGRDCGH